MFRMLTLSNVTKQQSWVPADAMSGTSSPRIPSRDMHGGTFCRGLRKSARYPETPRDLQLWVLLPPRLKGQGMWGLEPVRAGGPELGPPSLSNSHGGSQALLEPGTMAGGSGEQILQTLPCCLLIGGWASPGTEKDTDPWLLSGVLGATV